LPVELGSLPQLIIILLAQPREGLSKSALDAQFSEKIEKANAPLLVVP